MAQIGVTARTMKNISVVIGTDNFESAISALKFTPASSIATWKGGRPDSVFSDASSPTWSCDMTLATDWDLAGSLANYLFANVGQRKTCVFKPNVPSTGTTAIITATLILTAPEIGGSIDDWLTSSITHGVAGAPVITNG